MTFRTVCRAGLLLAGLTLSFTAAGRLPAARAAIQDGPYPASLNAQRASLHVLATPAGVYGVLTAGEFGREVFPAAAPLAVRVTYLYQSPACDERGCAVLGYQRRAASAAAGATPGYTFGANRLTLKLDDDEATFQNQGRARYGDRYYMTSYDVTLHFAGGKTLRKFLIGLY